MCGNFLVIVSIVYFKQLHTPTNYLILSLALGDLLVGLLLLPFSTILAVSSCWYLQDFLCQVRGRLDVFLCTSSILNLCFISVDRYFAVCQPLRYRTKITVRVTVIMILLNWTLSAINGVGVTVRGLNDTGQCLLFQNARLVIAGAVLAFYLPAVMMFSIYMRILTVARRQAISIHNTTCRKTASRAAVSKMETKATRTLAIVMGIFLICWTPFFLCVTIQPLSNSAIPALVIETFKWFGWSNSMFNPFVYAFFYSWFRSAFKMVISGKVFLSNLTHSKL
ncbi:uncharacterized protein V6R79_007024 [Siganus canaliculatus]